MFTSVGLLPRSLVLLGLGCGPVGALITVNEKDATGVQQSVQQILNDAPLSGVLFAAFGLIVAIVLGEMFVQLGRWAFSFSGRKKYRILQNRINLAMTVQNSALPNRVAALELTSDMCFGLVSMSAVIIAIMLLATPGGGALQNNGVQIIIVIWLGTMLLLRKLRRDLAGTILDGQLMPLLAGSAPEIYADHGLPVPQPQGALEPALAENNAAAALPRVPEASAPAPRPETSQSEMESS